MGNPAPGTSGHQPSPPGEQWVPISFWNLYLAAETPISWFLTLQQGGTQFRFWKGDVQPMPPEPPPVVGALAGWLIPDSIARDAGLQPNPDAFPPPPGVGTLAQQQGRIIADLIQAEINQLQAPLPPEGP